MFVLWGAFNTRAEIIPTEPDAGNADEGGKVNICWAVPLPASLNKLKDTCSGIFL